MGSNRVRGLTRALPDRNTHRVNRVGAGVHVLRGQKVNARDTNILTLTHHASLSAGVMDMSIITHIWIYKRGEREGASCACEDKSIDDVFRGIHTYVYMYMYRRCCVERSVVQGKFNVASWEDLK